MPTQDTNYNNSFSKIFIILASLICLVVALSVFVFSKESLRLDESQSLWQTSHSIPQMLYVVAQDVHVPLYHTMLHFWQLFLGHDVAVARILSLLFFMAAIPALYLLTSLCYGSSVGLFASFLFSISPFMNWYGNEIRMYSLLVLVTILNQYFFLRILHKKQDTEQNSKIVWLGYTATALLGTYTHYFFSLTLFVQIIFFVLYYKEFPKYSLLKFLAVAALVGAAFAPWLIYLVKLGFASNSRPLIAPPTLINVFNTFSQFVFGFQSDYINSILLSLWPLVVLFGFLGLQKNKKIRPETIYFLFSFVAPIIILFGLSFVRPLYLTRYLIFTLPSLYILIAWLFSIYPSKISWTIKSILVGIMILMLYIQSASVNTVVKEDYRDASLYLSSHVDARDVVVLSAPFTIYPVEYYYTGDASLATLPLWDRTLSGPIPPFVNSKLPLEAAAVESNHRRLWLLLSYDQGYEEIIRQYFDGHFDQLAKIKFSPGLDLYEYRLRYDTTDIETALANTSPKSVQALLVKKSSL